MLLRLMRPHQWVKNGFVLVGLLFGHGWTNGRLVEHALVLTAAFCLVSSGVYVLNDVFDLNADRSHPKKRYRPLANGDISARDALVLASILGVVGLGVAWFVSGIAAGLVGAYALINVGYSAGLKHIAVLDVFIIASGFMLRILVGTSGIGISPSHWLLACGLMLTLFLGFSKRRAELAGAETADVAVQRRSLGAYSIRLLDWLIAITASGAAIGYACYTLDSDTIAMHGTSRLIWTLPFVLYGIFHYLYALYRKGAGTDPAKDLVSNPHLIVALAGWLGLTWWLIAAA